MEYFKGQVYKTIKRKCAQEGMLFKDPEFPALSKSLFLSHVDTDIKWLRPGEIVKVPCLVRFGRDSRDDLMEGELKNAWFVTACSALVQNPKMLGHVFPDIDCQEWGDVQKYQGIFKLCFWRMGKWVEVVIDDQLPTKDGKLIFCHSKHVDEFWSSLLEKAYAKLYGDYESIKGCSVADVLVDFTGGVVEHVDLRTLRTTTPGMLVKFYECIQKNLKEHAVNIATMECPLEEHGQVLHNGLVKGCGYIIKDVKVADVLIEKTKLHQHQHLIQLHNPWGLNEWKGEWSDQSEKWKAINPNEKRRLSAILRDGLFWMDVADLVHTFTDFDALYLVNTSYLTFSKSWYEAKFSGNWYERKDKHIKRNGGYADSLKCLDNPQYAFDVTKTPEDSIMIALEQDDRQLDQALKEPMPEMGVIILKVENNRKYRVHRYSALEEKKVVGVLHPRRHVFVKLPVSPGRYVVLPVLVKPDQIGHYFLRIYSGSKSYAKCLELDLPSSFICCSRPIKLLTYINLYCVNDVHQGSGDQLRDFKLVTNCEGQRFTTGCVSSGSIAVFDIELIFYRKNPEEKPIVVDMYECGRLHDSYLGTATVKETGIAEQIASIETDVLKIEKKNKDVQQVKVGVLVAKIQSSYQLNAF